MSDYSDISSRHSLPAYGIRPVAQAHAVSVRVVIDDEWATSIAGQLIASCLVNLLCRQPTLITHIEVAAPATPILVRLPSGPTSTSFPLCLEELADWAVKDAACVSALASSLAVDYTIYIGGLTMFPMSTPGFEIVAVGEGWRAWIGDRQNAPRARQPTRTNPLGPFLAAALAAGEVFKRSRGILRGKYLSDSGFSFWSGHASHSWGELDSGPELDDQVLPPAHVVGAGAVGNVLAYVIANGRFRDAYLAVLDHDTYNGTNLNRCLLAGWDDVDDPKVDAVARALHAANVGAFAYPGTLTSYLVDDKRGLRSDIAAEVNGVDFGVVVSCVDRRDSRQDIQGLWPKVLLGGSTLDLQAKANVYGLRQGAACLGCYNRRERDADQLRSMEKRLGALTTSDRQRFLLDHRVDVGAIEDYLANPKCGSLGEAALRDFATRPREEFSVGFASLCAGLLLSSALFRHTIFADVAPRRGDMVTLNFLNGGMIDGALGTDPACELSCFSRAKS